MSASSPLSPVLAATQTEGKALLAESYEVRSTTGRFLFSATRQQATHAIRSGIADPIGQTCVKYLRIRSRGDVASHAWRGGSHTTERIRNESGDIIGAPKSGLQHKELPRQN